MSSPCPFVETRRAFSLSHKVPANLTTFPIHAPRFITSDINARSPPPPQQDPVSKDFPREVPPKTWPTCVAHRLRKDPAT
jgi:hypothetical protein